MGFEENRVVSFEDYLFQSFASLIASWNSALVSDIYALGFLVHFENQDLRYGTVGLVYNTNQNYQTALASVAARSTEADAETKWHFDYWCQHDLWEQDELPMVGKGHGTNIDSSGAALRRGWLEDQHLWFSDEEEEADFDRTLNISGCIETSFYDVCVRVAIRLHTERYTKIGNNSLLPIVFHNEYDDLEAECTRKANPPRLAQDYEQYVLVTRRSPNTH